jgi:ketosteroid isomerase-like protein
MAYWTGVQHTEARLADKDEPAPMKLRTTEILRFEDDGWKLAHRHAGIIEQEKSR